MMPKTDAKTRRRCSASAVSWSAAARSWYDRCDLSSAISRSYCSMRVLWRSRIARCASLSVCMLSAPETWCQVGWDPNPPFALFFASWSSVMLATPRVPAVVLRFFPPAVRAWSSPEPECGSTEDPYSVWLPRRPETGRTWEGVSPAARPSPPVILLILMECGGGGLDVLVGSCVAQHPSPAPKQTTHALFSNVHTVYDRAGAPDGW
ncbi:hypothetical protein B0T18DRAFT_417458 [Schizothecium vesticola]|uniref:Uncharacterized protein n=1 Tax=Schizothecium vesticola TaxID=314040 RepID=A0AA40EJ03_9PEZI|nr:hypothetical protein B0T18DRAFT_417458 [Schizothecium vesticola]